MYGYNKRELLQMKDSGYKVIRCDNEGEAMKFKNELRMLKMCAIAGKIKNSNNEEVYFVCTKERAINGRRVQG